MTKFLLSIATPTTISILLLLFSPPLITANPVLDSEGNPVQAYQGYYIQQPVWIHGGLKVSYKPGQNICPLFVRQGSELEPGTPVIFIPPSYDTKTINESLDVNISFVRDHVKRCRDGVWKLTTDATNGHTYVTTGGADSHRNWFKIEKNTGPLPLYKITYSPILEVGELKVRGDLGLVKFSDWYGLSDAALSVLFHKA